MSIFGIAYFALFLAVAGSVYLSHEITQAIAVVIIGIFGFWGPTNAKYRSIFFRDQTVSNARVAIGTIAIFIVVLVVTDFKLLAFQYLALLLACGSLFLGYVKKNDSQ